MASRRLALLALLVVATPHSGIAQTAAYFPGDTWQHKTPTESGIDAALLKEAIDFAIAGESKSSRDLTMNHYQSFGREPIGHDGGTTDGVVRRLLAALSNRLARRSDLARLSRDFVPGNLESCGWRGPGCQPLAFATKFIPVVAQRVVGFPL